MKKLEQIDWYWFTGLTVLALGYCVYMKISFFESSILVTGILCVALIAIGLKEGYIFGLYNSIAYAWVAYENGLFGEVSLNLLFYLPTGVLGYFMWKKNQKNHTVLMRKLASKNLLKILFGMILFILVLGFILSNLDGQNNPLLDATTNAIGICATFLMMYRFIEQWIFYIVLNCITIALWVLRYLDESMEADTMIFMWMLFLANSIFGYFTWVRKNNIQVKNSL